MIKVVTTRLVNCLICLQLLLGDVDAGVENDWSLLQRVAVIRPSSNHSTHAVEEPMVGLLEEQSIGQATQTFAENESVAHNIEDESEDHQEDALIHEEEEELLKSLPYASLETIQHAVEANPWFAVDEAAQQDAEHNAGEEEAILQNVSLASEEKIWPGFLYRRRRRRTGG